MTNFPPPPPPPQWGTYIPTRYGYRNKFKHHTTLGHAKSAIANAVDMYGPVSNEEMQLVHWDGTEWVVQWIIPAGSSKDDLPWRKP